MVERFTLKARATAPVDPPNLANAEWNSSLVNAAGRPRPRLQLGAATDFCANTRRALRYLSRKLRIAGDAAASRLS